MSVRSIALFALASGLASVANAVSGDGTTTRYWDCCKPSCSWSGKGVANPVNQCSKTNTGLTQGDDTQKSGCDNGGGAYMCADQTPWAASKDAPIAYGFAAAKLAGLSEQQQCCSCVELTFKDTSLGTKGKKMVVQITNTGSDLVSNQFDIAFPGGGVGIFNACTNQYGSFPLGQQYGGIDDGSLCAQYPAALQAGCNFRFNWFEGANNPSVSYRQVVCPASIVAKTGCRRDDEAGLPTVDDSAAPAASSPAASSSAAAKPAASAPAASAPAASAPAASSSAYTAPANTYTAPAAKPTTAESSPAAGAPAYSASASSPAEGSSYVSAPAGTLPAYTDSPSTTAPAATYPAASQTSTEAAAPKPTGDEPASGANGCPVQYVYVEDLEMQK